jgi:hypothetical protein
MTLQDKPHTNAGVIKAIAWLRAMGRPILADKMERELLHVTCREHGTLRKQHDHGIPA